MSESQQLLAEYVRTGSESTFGGLVSSYIGLVYSAALRLTNGNTHFAEDVTQIVFADLARLARTLRPDTMLGGWLHRHTCFVASNVLRAERRRLLRERQAVEMNAQQDHSEANLTFITPILDEAINQLGATDRTAILLRFFEQRDLQGVGEALGSNENAARMRINRALGKLETILKRRGVALSGATLGTLLVHESLVAAPAGLALTISTTALATAGASATSTSFILTQLMASTKLKASVAGIVLVLGIAAPLLVQRNANAKTHEQNEALQQRSAQLAQLETENKRLSVLAGSSLSQNQLADLERLRTEVGALKRQTNGLAQLRQENQRLKASTERPRTFVEVREEMIFRANYASRLTDAMFKFAKQNGGNLPTTIEQAIPFMETTTNAPVIDLVPDQYEIMVQGNPQSLGASASNIIVLREREPWRTGALSDPKGRWGKYYGYADGGVRFRPQTESNFDEFEKQHLPPGRK